MEYIFISMVTIAVTTLVVYKIINDLFKVKIQLRSLWLCAACAAFISMVLPRVIIGYANLLGTIVVLTIFAIIFAYFIAYYDSDKTNANKEINEWDPRNELDRADNNQASLANEATATISIESNHQNNAGNQDVEGDVYHNTFKHSGTDKVSGQDIGIAETNDQLVQCVLVDEQEANNDSKNLVTDCDKHNTEIQLSNNVYHNTTTGDTREEYDELTLEETMKFQCLDDVLDEAFNQKELGNVKQALQLFRYALKHYPDSEAGPLIVVELGSILKSIGYYDEAIQVFVEGRRLPSVSKDKAFEQEFTQTIAYLRIIKNILVQYHLGCMAYEKIPQYILDEIEQEFREWRHQV